MTLPYQKLIDEFQKGTFAEMSTLVETRKIVPHLQEQALDIVMQLPAEAGQGQKVSILLEALRIYISSTNLEGACAFLSICFIIASFNDELAPFRDLLKRELNNDQP